MSPTINIYSQDIGIDIDKRTICLKGKGKKRKSKNFSRKEKYENQEVFETDINKTKMKEKDWTAPEEQKHFSKANTVTEIESLE